MIVVIFEGIPQEGKMEDYLARTPKYKDELGKIDGFIANERYQSCSDPNKVLSISFWKDEASIKQFREIEMHRKDELDGRENLFEDYRICLAKVFRDYGLNDRRDAPK
jgi:heme-degrading monooxygenase HmoA